jgi:hypothetical protein
MVEGPSDLGAGRIGQRAQSGHELIEQGIDPGTVPLQYLPDLAFLAVGQIEISRQTRRKPSPRDGWRRGSGFACALDGRAGERSDYKDGSEQEDRLHAEHSERFEIGLHQLLSVAVPVPGTIRP